MARVQVAPLDAPEKLQPSGVQSDTFAAAAQPVIDQNYQRLADSLGHFSSTLNQYHRAAMADAKRQEAADKKAFIDKATGEILKWELGKTNDEILHAQRNGLVPYQGDPYVANFIDQDYGRRLAGRFAEETQKHFSDNPTATLQPGFEMDSYLRDRLAGFLKDNPVHSTAALKTFKAGIDSARNQFTQWDNKQKGERYTQAVEQASYNQLGDLVRNGLDAGYTPEQHAAYIQKGFKELGRRAFGGVGDLSYGKLQELQLNVYEDIAKTGTPDQAKRVMALLEAPRQDALTGQPLGKLEDDVKYRDKVRKIREHAIGNFQGAEKKALEEQVVTATVDGLMAGDGRTNSMKGKVNIPLPSGGVAEIDQDKIRKGALEVAIAKIRSENKGLPNYDQELRVAVAANMEHPEVVPMLQAEASAAITMLSQSNVKPEQRAEAIGRFVRAATVFEQVADKNGAYLRQYLKGDAEHIYDAYHTLTKYGKQDPTTAVMGIMSYYNQPEPERVKAEKRHAQDIETKVKTLDFNGWWPGGTTSSWSFLGQRVTNGGEVQENLTKYATSLMRFKGMSAEDAISAATEKVQKESVFVNGRVIFGVKGFSKDDAEPIQAILDKRFTDNPEVMKKNNVTKSSQLTLVALPNGSAYLAHSDTLDPILVTSKDPVSGAPITAPIGFSTEDVIKVKAKHEESQKNYTFQKAIQIQKAREAERQALPQAIFKAPSQIPNAAARGSNSADNKE